jgi:hypothetical protein
VEDEFLMVALGEVLTQADEAVAERSNYPFPTAKHAQLVVPVAELFFM